MARLVEKRLIEEILADAGIGINGRNPWDISVKDDRFYRRVLFDGSLGLGESYMDGWWECDRLDEFFSKIIPTNPEAKIKRSKKLQYLALRSRVFDLSGKSRAYQVGKKHYDIGNDLFRLMLDRRMCYSCAYWETADTLDDAQEAKLDLICRKLGLKPGDRVLDIGCGWGSLIKYAAERYRVEAVGITVSAEQVGLGREICAGLPVEIRLQDYRDIDEPFDHIVSVGMFEHVGHKNYRTYMRMVHRCLRDGGLFLLPTIGKHFTENTFDPWLEKYIFPNTLVPSMKQIAAAADRSFIVEDWHNFSAHYDQTLMAWFGNLDSRWDTIRERYDDRFYRMWKYYLLSNAGAFRCRSVQLWQIVMSKHGVPGGYTSVR
jgi:cyclopropane-fatty-acyl-phospholipid synthase